MFVDIQNTAGLFGAMVVLCLAGCARPPPEYVSPDVDMTQHLLTRKLELFPKKHVFLRVIVAPEEARVQHRVWHDVLFPPAEQGVSFFDDPPALPVERVDAASPDVSLPPCLYGIAGRYDVYASRLLAEMAAWRHGMPKTSVYPLCL